VFALAPSILVTAIAIASTALTHGQASTDVEFLPAHVTVRPSDYFTATVISAMTVATPATGVGQEGIFPVE